MGVSGWWGSVAFPLPRGLRGKAGCAAEAPSLKAEDAARPGRGGDGGAALQQWAAAGREGRLLRWAGCEPAAARPGDASLRLACPKASPVGSGGSIHHHHPPAAAVPARAPAKAGRRKGWDFFSRRFFIFFPPLLPAVAG